MKIFDRFKRKKREQELAGAAPRQEPVSSKREGNAVAVTTGREAVKSGTGQAYRILLKPLLTEKSSSAAAFSKYAFMVDPKANKNTVREAVEKVYGVKVKDVNMANYQGKEIRYGRYLGRRKNWRKAIVTLEKGQHIEVYSKA